MTRVVYYAATTLNGYIADEDNSLDWLFAVESPDSGWDQRFMAGIGVMVEGSTTYEWVLREERLLEEPTRWRELFGDRPTFVFTSRELPVPDGADVRIVSGGVSQSFPAIAEAAAGRDVWIVGGGDLAGQFFDAGQLDELQLSVAPATLTGGAPVLPRRIDPSRLHLRGVEQRGQFAHLVYDIVRPASA